jgi:hypothetical protein
MNATRQEAPGNQEIEALLPWHAAGTLSQRDAQRVEEALANDPELASRYALVREELGETIRLNEALGAPSARALETLFAKIDAEPARRQAASLGLGGRITGFFASLSPRTLAWSAALGALLLVAQAGVIGAVLFYRQSSTFQTASLSMNDRVMTRSLSGKVAAPRALVRFAPDARMSDITALLDNYEASIVDAKGGLFRLQFGDGAMTKDRVARLITRLQNEKIVNLAVEAQ